MSAIDPKDLHEMAEGNLSNYVRDHIHAAADEIEALRKDAERYRWRKENPAIEVEVFRGRYRCTARDSVVTDWLDSYDEAIDAAMQGANVAGMRLDAAGGQSA